MANPRKKKIDPFAPPSDKSGTVKPPKGINPFGPSTTPGAPTTPTVSPSVKPIGTPATPNAPFNLNRVERGLDSAPVPIIRPLPPQATNEDVVRGVASNQTDAVLGVAGGIIDFLSQYLAENAGRDKMIWELADRGIITPYMEGYIRQYTRTPGGFGMGGVYIAPQAMPGGKKATVTDPAKAALIDQAIEEAAEKNKTAWQRGEKVTYGAEVMFGEKDSYSFNEIIAGLGYDITRDPLTFVGSGTISAIKGVLKTGKASVDAGVDALRGNVSREAVERKTQIENVLPVEKIKEPKVKISQEEITASERLGLPIGEEIKRIKDLGTYVTTPVKPTLQYGKAKLNLGFVAASSIEAGKKAFLTSIRTDIAREAVRDTLQDGFASAAKFVDSPIKTVVTKEGGRYAVRTPSGERIGVKETKEEALRLAKETEATVNAKQTGQVAVDNLPIGVKQDIPNDPQPQSIQLPTEDGGKTVLELNVPYQASDGSVWVYDGDNVKSFSDLEGAQLSLVQRGEAPKATVSKSGSEYAVRAGDYVETFPTKSEATAAAKAYNTGQVSAPTRTTSGKKPKVDLQPTPQFTVADIGKGKVGSKEATTLKKILKNLDDLAQKTPGKKIRLAQSNQRLLRRIIKTGFLTEPDALRYLNKSLRKDFENALKLAKVDGTVETPYSLLKTLTSLAKQSGPDAENLGWLRDLVASITVRVDNSVVSLSNLAERFPNYVSDVPTLVHKQIAAKIEKILEEAKLVASSKNLGAVTESRRFEKLSEVFGDEIAKGVKATGILKGDSPAAREKFLAFEQSLLGEYQNVAYGSLDELIEGLKNNDSVNSDNLLKIFKEIDPDTQITKSTTKAMDKGTGAVLRDIFLKETVQTVEEMKKKVILAGDVEELLGASGIGFDDLLAAAIKYLQEPNTANTIGLSKKTRLSEEWLQAAILRESPAEQMKLFSDSKSPLSGRSWSTADDMVLLSLRRTMVNKFNLEDVMRNSENYYEGQSSLGQKVVKMSEQNYVSETGAVLTNIFGQADELRLVESLTALIRGRVGKSITAGRTTGQLTPANTLGKEKQVELRNLAADKQIDEFVYQMDLASAVLSPLGIRITRTKEANDWAFDAAYEAEVSLAKIENRPVNYNRKADAHYAYLHMGDIFKSFTDNNGRDLLRRGFFPVASKETYDKNTLSFMGLGDAARRVLELDGKNMLIDAPELVDELTRRILKKTSKMKTSSAAFAKQRESIAREMAEHLIKPEVIVQLREAHLSKAIGSAERFLKEIKTINDDILTTMRDGMRAANAVGDVSDAVRLTAVRQYLRQLALAGNLFAAQGGRYAEDMFNAYSMMFAEYGRLPASLDTPAGSILKIIDDEEAKMLRVQLYQLDAQVAPDRVQRQTAAGFKFRSAEELKPYEIRLEVAQETFNDVMSRIGIARTGSTQEIASWEKEYQKAKAKLERARTAAAERGIQTYHYMGGRWIPSEQYNPELALRQAEELDLAYVAGQAGVAARALIDSAPVVPAYKILKGKALQKALKFENVELGKARVEKSKKHGEEIAAAAIEDFNKYDELFDDPAEAAMHLTQEVELKHLTADMSMPPVVHVPEELVPEMVQVNTEFQGIKILDANTYKSEARERFSAVFGKEDIAGFIRKSETKGFIQSAASANFLERLIKKSKDATPDDFVEAFGLSISGGQKISNTVSPQVQQLVMRLRPFIDSIREGIKDMSVEGISDAMARYGVSERVGYTPNPGRLKESIENIFLDLPFVKQAGAKADEELARVKRLEQLSQSGLHPAQVFENMVKALSMVKAEQGLAANITKNFGWKTVFNTYEEAVAAKWVGVEAMGAKSDIVKAIPSPKDGGLFPPEIATQIGAAARHWNQVLTTPRNEFVTVVSQWTGLSKVFMTVLRPGYHVLNATNELTTAVIRGVVNPIHYSLGARIMAKHVAATLPAEYGGTVDLVSSGAKTLAKGVSAILPTRYGGTTDIIAKLTGTPDSLDKTLERAMAVWKDTGKASQKVAADGQATVSIKTVGLKGKKSEVELSLDEIAAEFERYGILEKNIFINNFQGLDDAAILGNPDSTKMKFMQKTGLKVAKATQFTGKAAGDLSMVYNNTIRAAHAMKIIQSKTWSSLDAAMKGAADELAIFHPTSKSLGSAERRNSAVISTFYTWMRMAHVMTYKMALENNREIYAVANALYYYNTLQGEQPQSRGTPFSDPSRVSQYNRFKVGQALVPGDTEANDLMVKTPFTVFEVSNFWQFNVDMGKNLDENVTSLFLQQGLETAYRSGPVAFQIAAKLGTGRDFATGIPTPRENLGDVMEVLLSVFPAITSPFRAAGIDLVQETSNIVSGILGTTPSSQNREITDQQEIIARLNYLLGTGAFAPNSAQGRRQAKFFELERKKKAAEKRRYERQKELGLK